MAAAALAVASRNWGHARVRVCRRQRFSPLIPAEDVFSPFLGSVALGLDMEAAMAPPQMPESPRHPARVLVGISGKIGSGKSTAAEHLGTAHGFKEYAFARPLKTAASALFGVPLVHFEDRRLKETVVQQWGMSPRRMLQWLGTDLIRDNFRDDFLVARTMMEVDSDAASALDHDPPSSLLVPAPRFRSTWHVAQVISDVRFDNEARAILERGGEVWKVERPADDTGTALELELDPGAEGAQQQVHASERGISPDLVTRTIRNDTSLSDFIMAIDDAVFEYSGTTDE